MWPERRSRMPGQDLENQSDRAQVVELDRSLVVVQAVVRVGDRAPDRHSRVVHEDVDAAVLCQDLLGHGTDRIGIGEVTRVDVRLSPDLLDLRLHRLELFAGARDKQDPGAVHSHPDGGCLADARRGAGDEHGLALNRRTQGAVAKRVRLRQVARHTARRLGNRSDLIASRRPWHRSGTLLRSSAHRRSRRSGRRSSSSLSSRHPARCRHPGRRTVPTRSNPSGSG